MASDGRNVVDRSPAMAVDPLARTARNMVGPQMTDHIALTDEELIEVERRSDLFVDSLLWRAVADLRAMRLDYQRLVQALHDTEAEVERLREKINSYQEAANKTFWGPGW